MTESCYLHIWDGSDDRQITITTKDRSLFLFLFLFCSILIIRENMVVEIIRVIMVQGWVASLAFWGCYFSFPSALRSVALFGWQDSFFAIWWCCCLLNWSIKWSMLITRISFHLWNRVGLRSTNTELLFFSKQYRNQEVIWDTGGLLSKKFTLLRNSSSLLHCVSCWFRRFP